MKVAKFGLGYVVLSAVGYGCSSAEAGTSDVASGESETSGAVPLAVAAADDYCSLPRANATVIAERPGLAEPPVDDVNWFARPVKHDGADRIIAFASHDQNYLYNLTTGARVQIPDRSDAVATPDGRYMTVPSYYTPDSNVRFYPVAPLLDALEAGRDATDVEPVFIHDHPAMHRVYYQSTALLSEETTEGRSTTTYRLMFSGTGDESGFRIADYDFVHSANNGELLSVTASDPMTLCPEIRNDLNTPFISKDGRYVAAYTSHEPGRSYTEGASLKLFEITDVAPERGTTACRMVHDFGFAAGKADFSFDGSMLTFHISQGAYLTPFVNGGLDPGTITDVVTARLVRSQSGDIIGADGIQRMTTSTESGVGSYFPAFFPDGTLFYVANAVPKDSPAEKRFYFRVVDPAAALWVAPRDWDGATRSAWQAIAGLWGARCSADRPDLGSDPFPLQEHEAPWLAHSLGERACVALLDDARAAGAVLPGAETWDGLAAACGQT